jgi:hypothetical protein
MSRERLFKVVVRMFPLFLAHMPEIIHLIHIDMLSLPRLSR